MHLTLTAQGLPLTRAELEECRTSVFADDVEISDEAEHHWTEAHALEYFESGGAVLPVITTATPALVLEPRPLAWWAGDGGPLSICPCAQQPEAHTDTITRVRLFRDTDGAVSVRSARSHSALHDVGLQSSS